MVPINYYVMSNSSHRHTKMKMYYGKYVKNIIYLILSIILLLIFMGKIYMSIVTLFQEKPQIISYAAREFVPQQRKHSNVESLNAFTKFDKTDKKQIHEKAHRDDTIDIDTKAHGDTIDIDANGKDRTIFESKRKPANAKEKRDVGGAEKKIKGDDAKGGNTEKEKPDNTLPLCPEMPPGLAGKVEISKHIETWEDMAEDNPDVRTGGRSWPTDCKARQKVAIVIPYRDREQHLKKCLRHLHSFLRKQQLDYGIYVIELEPDILFNRAMLLNIGFVEALKRYDYDCVVLHDADLFPENDHNLYRCTPDGPRHLSACVDSLGYKMRYDMFGGVTALTPKQMYKVNGYSNLFFGWGKEDDNMLLRLYKVGLKVQYYKPEVARYTMIKHHRSWHNPIKAILSNRAIRYMTTDGLKNNLIYNVTSVTEHRMYTNIRVYIDQNAVEKNFTEFLDAIRVQRYGSMEKYHEDIDLQHEKMRQAMMNITTSKK